MAYLYCFFLACLTRIYWIHKKENLCGDEFTSICIAYDHPGWGKKTYRAEHIYTGKELRQQFYIDIPEKGILKELWHDLTVLHHDNRDSSHASLYYMTLRCTLTGMDSPSMEMLIRRCCGLNLLFFSLSFLGLSLILRTLFPKRIMLIAFCLLTAYMNPASISNVLLIREYSMAECLFVFWAYWCLRASMRIRDKQPIWTIGISSSGLILSASCYHQDISTHYF